MIIIRFSYELAAFRPSNRLAWITAGQDDIWKVSLVFIIFPNIIKNDVIKSYDSNYNDEKIPMKKIVTML